MVLSPRVFATPSGATTYTASFRSQYLLSTAVNPLETGAVIGAGYRDANSVAPVVATCDPGYKFISWTGRVTASTSPSTEVLIAAPVAVTANCQLVTATAMPPASGHYNESATLSATVGPPGTSFAATLQFQVDGVNIGDPIAVTGAGVYTTGMIDDGLLAGAVILAQDYIQVSRPIAILFAEPTVMSAVRMLSTNSCHSSCKVTLLLAFSSW